MKKIMFLMMSLMMMSFGAMADSSPTSTATPTNGATHCDTERNAESDVGGNVKVDTSGTSGSNTGE